MPRMRLKRLFAVAAVCTAFALAACGEDGRDGEVNAFLDELEAFKDELVGKVRSASNPSEGVDAARRFLDARKAEMAAKIKSVREVPGERLKEETRKRREERITEDSMSVSNLQIEYIDESFKDPAFKARLDKLAEDYQSLFQP